MLRHRFLLPLLAGLLGAAFLASLGLWQLNRLEWKEALLAEIDARIVGDPIALPETPDEARDRFQPVALTGTFGEEELRVLASLRIIGPIWRLIRPFETADGRRILVDIGYVREGQQSAPRPGGPASITGNLHWPDDLNSSTPAPDIAANIWFARDLAAMAEALGTEPLMVVLRDGLPPETGVTPLPVTSAGIPNDHLGYAVQWFLLAAVWLGMTLFFLLRMSKRPTIEE